MPPCASRIRPSVAWVAPVNAPFAWPKSSDSSSSAGIAPQLIATNGPSARVLARWMLRATSSFPVPLSPQMRTFASEGATLRTSSVTRRIPADSPIMRRSAQALRRLRFRSAFSRRIRRSASARSTACRKSSLLNGLMT